MSADTQYPCDQVVDIEQEPRHHLVFANQFVRAFAVEVAPHDRTLCHRHPNDYLLYVASGAEIISAARGEEPKRLSYADGECELSEAGLIHVVANLSDKPFRNIVVELLPRAGELRRGNDPRWTLTGEAMVNSTFDDERAAIFSIQIGPGAEIKIAGAAIVATPYGNALSAAAVGDIQVCANPICDLAWIPPQHEAVLWGCWEQTETAIVFQIGRANEQGYAVPSMRTPLRTLRAHADEPE